MSRVTRWYVGIDLHRDSMQAQVLDGEGKPHQALPLTLRGAVAKREAVKALQRWQDGGRYAVEAMGLNRWLVNAMQAAGMDVVVADPVKLGLKALRKKTDRQDALQIARRLWLGDIDANARTYYPDDVQYGRRKLVRIYKKLVGMRTRCVNQIRCMLNAYAIEAPAGPLYHSAQLQWLTEVPLPTPELREVVQALRAVLIETDRQVQRLDGQIQRVTKTGWAGTLRQIAEIGPITAMALAEEVGDVSRFRNARAVAGYVGLAPRVNQSAQRSYHGPLTRRGNPDLRHLLGQMAVRLLTRDPLVQQWARPREPRMGKNKLRTALARQLLVGLVASERRGEPFELRRCLNL